MRAVHWMALLGFGLIAVLFLVNLVAIPFHPDETSLLYQSRDLEQYLQNPLTLAYLPSESLTQDTEYRALNAPLAKYVLGIGRRLAGAGPRAVATDWNWQADWEQNLRAGAMPSTEALIGGRAASTLMALLALPLIAWAGHQLGGWSHSLISGLLYGLNALVLLHGRRAMAEGTLLFAIALLIATAFIINRRPWLTGLGAGLAISAKHSALPLIAMPITGLLLRKEPSENEQKNWRSWVIAASSMLLIAGVLYPFAWKHPLSAIETTLKSRQDFVEEQVAITEALAAGSVLDTPAERLASLLGHTYFLPPQFQEVGNYEAQLSGSFQDYRQNPLHNLMVGPIQGSILFGMTLLGLWGGFRSDRFRDHGRRRNFAILAVGTAFMVGSTLLLNPLPYQRYYLPLVPLLILWQATGLLSFLRGAQQLSHATRD